MSASGAEREERVKFVTNDDGTVQIEGSDLTYAKDIRSITLKACQLNRVRGGFSRSSLREPMERFDSILCDGASIHWGGELGIMGTDRSTFEIDIEIIPDPPLVPPALEPIVREQPRTGGIDEGLEDLPDLDPEPGSGAGTIGYFEGRFYCRVHIPADAFEALIARYATGKPFTLYLDVRGIFWLRSVDRWTRDRGVSLFLAPDKNGSVDFPVCPRVDVLSIFWEDTNPKHQV